MFTPEVNTKNQINWIAGNIQKNLVLLRQKYSHPLYEDTLYYINQIFNQKLKEKFLKDLEDASNGK
jgi:hypothetical protein